MSKNILIVESENDKLFFDILMKSMDTVNIEESTNICNIDDYECIGGMGNLEARLNGVKRRVYKEDISKIGIIFDADKIGKAERESQIEEIVKKVFKDSVGVEIKIHVLNIDGNGELETVLKTIKTESSIFADCLDSWRDCLKSSGLEITDKEFDKFWVQIYQRYDCCTKTEQKQAGRKCNNEASLNKDIWNFQDSVLDDVKEFLSSF